MQLAPIQLICQVQGPRFLATSKTWTNRALSSAQKGLPKVGDVSWSGCRPPALKAKRDRLVGRFFNLAELNTPVA